nr:MAG TPA: hypothetical protein [Caudoviricetes sp.]
MRELSKAKLYLVLVATLELALKISLSRLCPET